MISDVISQVADRELIFLETECAKVNRKFSGSLILTYIFVHITLFDRQYKNRSCLTLQS